MLSPQNVANTILKKIFFLIFFLILIFWSFGRSFWDDENKEILEPEINYKQNIFINDEFVIDLTKLTTSLKETSEKDIFVEWKIEWAGIQEWNILKRNFKEAWFKNIVLEVFTRNEEWEKQNRNIVFKKNIKIFVYKKTLAVIFDKQAESQKKDFTQKANEYYTYVYEIWNTYEKDINNATFLDKIEKYKQINKNKLDYFVIRWWKDFLFSTIWKLSKEIESANYKSKLNIVLVTPFNLDILKNYFKNFLSNKPWIKKMILIWENSEFQIIKENSSLNSLEKSLVKNKYDYIDINTSSEISNYLFISKFINNLSNKGFLASEIYILLLIPFLFTWISFMKHLIWISPIWVVIPILISILFFKLWILNTLYLLSFVVFVNIILGLLISKYTLLYTPKIGFIMIINIILLFIFINISQNYNLINYSINDILYIILFIIIWEKFLTLLLSKEFLEYKYNILNTIIFALLSFLIFNLDFVKTFIVSYPEIILFLAPINFYLGRFTWLRFTEYLRFREIIKNVKE